MSREGRDVAPLEGILEALPDALIWLDRDGGVVQVGGAPLNPFGTSLASLEGSTSLISACPPRVGEAIRRCLSDSEAQRCEWVAVHDEGSVAWELRAQPLDPGALLVIRDLTSLRRSGGRVEAEQERMVVALRSVADAVISTDGDDRIVVMNPAAEVLFGIRQELARGRPVDQVLGDAYLDSWGGVRPRVESVDALGRRRVSQVQFAPVVQSGQQVGSVYALRDVTEEEAAEAERLRASKLESVGLLAGGIAHDFNNLLAAIQGNVSVIREMVEDEEVREILDDVDRATRRATGLTRQLLSFAVGGAPLKAVRDLRAIVREAVDFGMRGSNVRQDYAFAEDLYPVEVDRGQVGQVLQNLVINACQAMPEGGRLLITARNAWQLPPSLPGDPGPWVAIAVADQGVGIVEANLGRVFDPYFTTKAEGTGLGLATSYAIVRRHGGHVTVESRPGEGSTFTVYLPASPDAPLDPHEGQDPPPPTLVGRALVVDDDPLLRKVAQRMLESLGLEVVTCADGEAGIEVYRGAFRRGEGFDVVFLDLTVPGGLGGRETVVRLLAYDPDACCVATSGYANDPVLADHHAHGFRDRLEKPYGKGDVARVLKRLLPRMAPARAR